MLGEGGELEGAAHDQQSGEVAELQRPGDEVCGDEELVSHGDPF